MKLSLQTPNAQNYRKYKYTCTLSGLCNKQPIKKLEHNNFHDRKTFTFHTKILVFFVCFFTLTKYLIICYIIITNISSKYKTNKFLGNLKQNKNNGIPRKRCCSVHDPLRRLQKCIQLMR